jgi:hypothetical protein
MDSRIIERARSEGLQVVQTLCKWTISLPCPDQRQKIIADMPSCATRWPAPLPTRENEKCLRTWQRTGAVCPTTRREQSGAKCRDRTAQRTVARTLALRRPRPSLPRGARSYDCWPASHARLRSRRSDCGMIGQFAQKRRSLFLKCRQQAGIFWKVRLVLPLLTS